MNIEHIEAQLVNDLNNDVLVELPLFGCVTQSFSGKLEAVVIDYSYLWNIYPEISFKASDVEKN